VSSSFKKNSFHLLAYQQLVTPFLFQLDRSAELLHFLRFRPLNWTLT